MKIKKNQQGMSLVEVVVSLAIFGFTTLCITMSLSAALRLNNRNMLRDRELNVQQKVIEEHTNKGIALMSGHSLASDVMVFGSAGTFTKDNGTGTQTGLTFYHAVKTSEHGEDYNFEIKGISSPRNTLGNADGDYDKANNKYCIHVVNNTTKNADVYVQNSNAAAVMYEGSYNNGYRHSAESYGRTLTAKDAEGVEDESGAQAVPSELFLGYYSNGMNA
ncbi:MAG: prepilin-type N-terminal cleavage/methylation domain-containing protein, partial [Ruminococcus sp.]|nr:prepilin-type N-terminal cleavage/methylation domain-containing protein [Ruminococcus sp.]